MALTENILNIFSNDYPGTAAFIDAVVKPIFGDDIENVNIDLVESHPEYEAQAKNAGIKKIQYVGDLTDQNLNSDNIALLDVTIDDRVNIERARVNIQQLIRKVVVQFSHMLIVFHYENPCGQPWRFSYAYKAGTIADTTSAKRYTYVFGRGYRGRTAAERFAVLARSKRKNQDFIDAFSVEALSDEFFDKYREMYADFVEYITGTRYEKEKGTFTEKFKHDPDPQFATTFDGKAKAVRDYIKKMFGRIVFLYFLQRKGWLYDNEGNAKPHYMHDLFAESSEKDDFLDNVLEVLFFYVLNTKAEQREEDARAFGFDIKKIPGWQHIPYLNGGLFEKDDIDPERCKFPADYFQRLFDFLDSYNFTIDENDQEDAEVGIDPEMLGRIFENLLEDNKDKGAFYTPKEIVDYMCRESIIAYLQNDASRENGRELIRRYVETLDIDLLSKDQRDFIEEHLLRVKICDPAIGSGAFPMGLVNLLSKLFISLRTYSTIDQAKMKRYIMQQNIYGVDIEKGAVDIARLRFWLAMVVDETEPQPLPNLHFKIMQGNSLLESYQGADLSDLTKTGAVSPSLFDSDDAEREFLRSALRRYYGASDHRRRAQLFNDITNNVRRQLYAKNITLPTGIDPSENSLFFLWHTWFADIFEKGGFDIVIGNPPYIRLQNNGGYLAKLYDKSKFESFARTGDIYCLFYEQGWRLLKNNGHLCYITSNKWMRTGYGESLRRFLCTRTNPMLLLDFAGIQVFDATVDSNILLFSKDINRHNLRAVSCAKRDKTILNNLSDFVQQNASILSFYSSESWVILSPIEQSIKRKIEAVGTPLKDWNIQINYGIKTGFNVSVSAWRI